MASADDHLDGERGGGEGELDGNPHHFMPSHYPVVLRATPICGGFSPAPRLREETSPPSDDRAGAAGSAKMTAGNRRCATLSRTPL